MDWFRVDSDVVEHPRVMQLAHRLHISRTLALGHLVTLWARVAKHAESGSLAGIEDSVVEQWAEWHPKKGAKSGEFVAALIAIGALTDNAKRELRGWKKRNDYLMRERKRKQDMEKRRARPARNPRADSVPTKPNETEPNISVSEKHPDARARAPEPPASRPPGPVGSLSTGFSAAFWESDEVRADRERLVERALSGGGLESYAPEVAAEVERVSRAQRKTKPQKYATGMVKNRDGLREIAARLQAERADRVEASRVQAAAGPPGAAPPPVVEDLVAAIGSGGSGGKREGKAERQDRAELEREAKRREAIARLERGGASRG